jgi:hypothetical protein
LALLGLLNVFGQRPVSQTVRAGPASLKVYAPVHLRGGNIFTARFHIYAHSDLKRATLVLSSGWFEGMTFNGISPQPVSEGSSNGQPTFVFGHVPAGQSVIAFFSMQVNPTNLGHRSSDVALYDGSNRLLSVHRSFTIWP